jgi:polysaccharide export outer membrane protein
MFRVDKDFVSDTAYFSSSKESNYKLRADDYINVQLYSNGGEIILDPNNWLQSSIQSSNQQQQIEKPEYLIETTGAVKLPLIGNIYLAKLTLKQADSLLSKAYSEFYIEPFVLTTIANRRVTIIGPEGGQIISLENENTNIIEIIALYGGMNVDSKAKNIRIIRGDLNNPHVQIIDLRTIKGMQAAQLQVLPNDIIYIEQVRKPFLESAKEWSSVIGIMTAAITLLVLITSIQK